MAEISGCDRTSSCEAMMHWSNCETNPERVEAHLEKNAITGLVNIYHAITGKGCERHLSLGMATSAVSSLKSQNEAYKQRIARLEGALRVITGQRLSTEMREHEINVADFEGGYDTIIQIARTALKEEE